MNYTLLIIFSVVAQFLAAQNVINVDKSSANFQNNFFVVNGEPISTAKYIRIVEGTGFFKDTWMKATAISPRGDGYSGEQVKLDLMTEEVYFLSGGTEMIATGKFKEIYFEDPATKATYRFVHSTNIPTNAPHKRGWYQQLHKGKMSLYKFYKKMIEESKPYGSATVEQRIKTVEEFYILHNNILIPIRKLKDFNMHIVENKKEIESYIKSADDKGTLAEKLTALVAHYNTLIQ